MGSAQGKALVDALKEEKPFPPDSALKIGKIFSDGLTAESHALLNENIYARHRTSTLPKVLENNVDNGKIGYIIMYCYRILDLAISNASTVSSSSLLGTSAGTSTDATTTAATATGTTTTAHTMMAPRGGEVALPPYTAAALRLASIVIRFAIEKSAGDTILLLKHINKENSAIKLCEICVEFILQIPLEAGTCLAHSEALFLLLVMQSTALHHSCDHDELRVDIFSKHMMALETIGQLLLTLVQRVTYWGNNLLPHSQYVYTEGYEPRLTNLYNLFGTMRKEQCVDVGTVIGRRSLHLLLVLLYFEKGRPAHPTSPALSCLKTWVDETDIPIRLLIEAIKNKMVQCPELVILLYLLMTEHEPFYHNLMARYSMDASTMCVDISHIIYECEEMMLNHLCTITLLLFSRDGGFNALLQRRKVHAPFVKERYLAKISIASLMSGCVIRLCAKSTLMSERNEPLATLCMALMSNIAPFQRHLDGYAAQRIVFFLSSLLKKIHRLHATLKSSPKNADNYSLKSEIASLTNIALHVIEVVLAGANNAHQHNYSLIYELLYQREVLAVLDHDESPKIKEALTPIAKIISFYESELASVSCNHTVEEIMEIIRKVTKQEGSSFSSLIHQGEEEHDEMARHAQQSDHKHFDFSATSVGDSNRGKTGVAVTTGTGGSNKDNNFPVSHAIHSKPQEQTTTENVEQEAVVAGEVTSPETVAAVAQSRKPASPPPEVAFPNTEENEGCTPEPTFTTNDAASIVEKHQKQALAVASLLDPDELVYTYEEAKNSYLFFGPLVWAMILSRRVTQTSATNAVLYWGYEVEEVAALDTRKKLAAKFPIFAFKDKL